MPGQSREQFGLLSGMPQVTSDGTPGSAVVWVTSTAQNGSDGELRAYSAIPEGGTLKLLWSGPVGTATKFAVVATSGNHVITGTRDGHLMVFGRPTRAAITGRSVDFGAGAVGQTRGATATFTAQQPITVTGAEVKSGTSFGVDASSLAGGVRVAAGGTLSLPVSFHPATWGSTTTQLTVHYTDATGASRTAAIDLHGLGQQTGLGFLPSPLDFGEVVTGEYRTMAVNVVNTGTTDERITSIEAPTGAFSSPALPPAGTTITAGNALSVPILFRPTGAGSYSGTLRVTTTSGVHTETVTGSAVTGQGHLSLSTKVVDFGTAVVGSNRAMDFTATNTGNIPVTLSLSKTPIGEFASSGSLPEGLAIGADDSIIEHVSFHPTAPGSFSQQYTIDAADGQGIQHVIVKGTAVQGTTVSGPKDAGDTAWQLNGSAATKGADLYLTDTGGFEAGSALTRDTVASEGLDAHFQLQMNGGSGADGAGFVLLPASDPATSLGATGGALGWGGLKDAATGRSESASPGVAVVFNTMAGTQNPPTTLVGVASATSDAAPDQYSYLASRTTPGDLREGTHDVEVGYSHGLLSVRLDGKDFLNAPVTLPGQVRPGFTGGTGGMSDNHIVRNVAITTLPGDAGDPTPTPTAPGSSSPVVQPARVTLVSPAAGATVSGSTVITATATGASTGSSVAPIASIAFHVDGYTPCTRVAAPFSCTWNTQRMADGKHTVTVVATDAQGHTATDTHVVTVHNATAPTPAPVDATVTTSGTLTTPALSTTGADRLLALVSADGVTGRSQTATLRSTSGGPAWSFVRRVNTATGTAEVWTATTSRRTSGIRVQATLANPSAAGLTVMALKGTHALGGNGTGSGDRGGARAAVTARGDN